MYKKYCKIDYLRERDTKKTASIPYLKDDNYMGNRKQSNLVTGASLWWLALFLGQNIAGSCKKSPA